jgi:hypothetical protein
MPSIRTLDWRLFKPASAVRTKKISVKIYSWPGSINYPSFEA